MRIKNALDLRDEMRRDIERIWRETEHFQRTHEDHLKEMSTIIWESAKLKKAPRWVRDYLRGVDAVLFDLVYSKLEWVLTGTDGKAFRKGNDDWLKESTDYKSAMVGYHVWITSLDKGEFKTF